MEKSRAYAISGFGILILALSIEPIYSRLSFIHFISSDVLMLVGVAISILGVAFSAGFRIKRGKNEKEVPIYRGKELVGYRVVKSK